MASITKRKAKPGEGKLALPWRVRYRDGDGRMHEKRFAKYEPAKKWAAEQEKAKDEGTHVDPKRQKITVNQWCDTWLETYGGADRTRLQARVHLALIKDGLGSKRLRTLQRSDVEKWLRVLEDQGPRRLVPPGSPGSPASGHPRRRA